MRNISLYRQPLSIFSLFYVARTKKHSSLNHNLQPYILSFEKRQTKTQRRKKKKEKKLNCQCMRILVSITVPLIELASYEAIVIYEYLNF